MLTLEMEKALIKGIRKQLATKLIKERKLYKEGRQSLKFNSHTFIKSNFITKTVKLSDKQSFNDLNKTYTDLTNTLDDYSYNLDIQFYSDYDGEGYSIEIEDPYAEITYKQFSMPTLKQVKSNVSCTVSNAVRDAKFKFVHQPNGKDVKRYLKIIEATM